MLLYIVLIIIGSTLVWYRVLDQSLLEEGYFYFNKNQKFFPIKFPEIPIWSHDNFAKIYFEIIPSIFRDNIKGYMATKLILFFLVGIVLFIVISKISKDKFLGFSAAIIFMANYIGCSEMLSPLSYQRFVQRVPNLLPAIAAFYYLHKFLQSKKIMDYLISLSLFSLAVLMGHFTSFLLPLFIIYPLTVISMKKIKLKNLIKTLILSGVFIIITFSLISRSPVKTSTTPNKFFSDEKWLGKIVYQIPTINVPGEFIKLLADYSPMPVPYPYTNTLKLLLIPMIIIYSTGAYVVYNKRRGLFPLYLTCWLSTFSIITLYVYFDTDIINVYRNFGQNRAYFLPALTNSIVWAILINTIFVKKLTKLIPLLLAVILIYNLYHIHKYLDTYSDKNRAMTLYLNYVKLISGKLNQDSVILSPREFQPSEPFIELFYGKPGLKIISLDGAWQKEVRELPDFSKDNFFAISYDYGKFVASKPTILRGEVLDLSAEYQKKLNSPLPK